MPVGVVIGAAIVVAAVIGGLVAYALASGDYDNTAGSTTPPVASAPPTTATTAPAPATVTVTPSEGSTAPSPAQLARWQRTADQLTQAISGSTRAHNEIAAHPTYAGASARLQRCVGIGDAISQLERAAAYRRQVLDELGNVHVGSSWPAGTLST